MAAFSSEPAAAGSSAVLIALASGLHTVVTRTECVEDNGGGGLCPGGATPCSAAVFLVARTSIGEALWERVKPFAGRMEEGFRDGEFNYLLFLRLLPVFPFWVVNLLPAFLGVKTGMYMLTTFVGIIPGTAVYNVIGDGLGEVFESGAEFSLENAVSTEIVVGLAGLAVIALVPVVVRKMRARRQDSK